MSKAPFIQLNDGNQMPALGLGTCAVSIFFNKSHSFGRNVSKSCKQRFNEFSLIS